MGFIESFDVTQQCRESFDVGFASFLVEDG
jgi:hypothetical protein